MKIYLLLFVLFTYTAGCSQVMIKKVSKKVEEAQQDQTGKFKVYKFGEVRSKVLRKYPNFSLNSSDTIFIVEKYDIEQGRYIGTIWNRKDSLHYVFSSNQIERTYESGFTTTTLNLLSAWDLIAIQKEEQKYGDAYRDVFASRCIIGNGKIIVDVLMLREFTLVDR